MELPKAYDPKATEEKIYQAWMDSGYFNPGQLPKRYALKAKRYSIHLPPPNITGSLHMGHALNATISDILIRYHRMRGYKTVWFPGIDHAGIATQNVVEKELKKEGKTRWDLGREKFIERVWQWREKYGGIILDQLKRLGASCDWSRTRFTMDPEYSKWVLKAFVHYHEKGLIYRGQRVVSWCPRCQTSLSDLEIEYKEETTKLYYFQYPLISKAQSAKRKASDDSRLAPSDSRWIVVATTRPETMLGDAAVAVNPKDKRYKDLVGKKVILPIQNREIPIVADEGVEMAFGTGAVKVTPAHDLLDAEIAERHKLPYYQVVGERGKMTDEAGALCAGMKAKECRDKVVAEMDRLGLIEKVEDYIHNISLCYRCGTELQPILSNQWFVKMKDLAQKALEAVKSGKVKIIPENFAKVYFDWLENIRDWTISRQIWWGHRLPVFFCKKALAESKNNEIATSPSTKVGAPRDDEKDVIASKAKQSYFTVTLEKPKECPFCKECEMEQSPDVLDTWFSSALWPLAGLSESDLKEFYPSNVLITARDIINLWVARMIFSGLEFMGESPFSDVLIHGTILTKTGQRMSKSKGTGIDPLELIEKYGADATRFGIVWQAMGNQDIRWDESAVQAGKKFANKMWNISRFVLGRINLRTSDVQNIESANLGTSEVRDKDILEKLANLKKDVESDIKGYQFGQALRKIYDFIWHELADKYIEASKNREDEAAKETLLTVLVESLKILHPFMPHLTEEIYQHLPREKQEYLIMKEW